jgi:translocation and assembly module TamB
MAESLASRSLAIALRSVWSLLTALILLVLIAFAALTWLDRPSGHSFLVGRLGGFHLENGLGFKVDSVEGSIYGGLRIHNLTITDQRGVVATAPLVDLDWRPRDFIENRLTIRSAHAPDLHVLRRPSLQPTSNPDILPKFDIFIGKLKIDRLALDAAVTGKPQIVSITGNADVHAGRALVNLDAHALTGGDNVRLKLDSEPDRDRFDVDALIDAPRGGVITGLARIDIPLTMRLTGDGKWSAWTGTATATSAAATIATFKLGATNGHFTLTGTTAPAPLLGPGVASRLTSPQMTVNADVRLVDRIATTQITLASRALTVDASGKLDFAQQKLVDVVVNGRLADPRAVSPQLNGRGIRAQARIAGSFGQPLVDYAVTAPALAIGTTTVTNLRATGVAQPGAVPMLIPVNATATRITGVNPAADALLTNVRIETRLRIGSGTITTEALTLRTDKLNATGTVQYATATGAFTGGIVANLPGYELSGTGAANVSADLRVTGGAGGVHVAGTARAAFTRFDNPSVVEQLGGRPVISTGIDIAPDLSMTFRDARVTAPALTLAGNGSLSRTGVLNFAASGSSRSFGPASFTLTGPLDKIEAEFRFASPELGIGLRDVIARITPIATGWTFDANGASLYGPVQLRGSIHTAPNMPLAVTLDQFAAAGLTAHGTLTRSAAGPFTGLITLLGQGVNGQAQLSAVGTTQRAEISLTAKDARIGVTTPTTIAAGNAQAVLLVPAGGAMSVTGKFALTDLRRGDGRIIAADGTVNFANGNGTAQIHSRGIAGTPFALNSVALLSGNHLSISADGSLGGRPLKLEHAAELTHSDKGWTLAPTVLVTPEGRTQISGSFGDDIAFHAQINHLGLGLSSLFLPSVDLTGNISGTIDFSFHATDALPTGTANLRVTGLSRASAGKSAAHIDLGINAALAGGKASARMVIAREGRIEGRAQAQLAVIPGGRADPVMTRLLAAPLFAQLRWSGPSQAIWQFAGVDAIDVRGPMTIAVDMGGVLGDPSFSGSLTADGARIEGTAIGLVFDKVMLETKFAQSRLSITKFTAGAGKDGTISGTGAIDLSAVRGFPTDIRLDLKNAQLINRDDLRGSATGAVHIVNGPDGAKISGKLEIDRARINLGVNSAADVPVLHVSEINSDAINRAPPPVVKPTVWQLDLTVSANNRIEVRGMGLDSEWSGDLKVTGRADAPSIVGPVKLVRGDYDFAGKRFRLTRGDVRFTGGFPPDALVNIVAENTSSNLTATLTISGTAQHPEISFSSIPALPEDEVLSRVLFGESVTNLSAPEALQLASALATLRGGSGGLNPINAVRKGLGIDRLRILPADTVTGRKTSIAAGQYIGDRVYVEVTSDAQGYNATSVEVSLTRSLSVLSQIATLGGTSFSVRWKRDY